MNTTTAQSRVIVGIGDNTASDTALAYAITEARRRGGELVAVRTWGPLADPSPRDATPPGAETELRAGATQRISHAFTTVGGTPTDIQVSRRIPEGPAGPALVAVADRPDDLIVIGRSHHHLARRAMCGSVPDYVMDHATCPVLIQPRTRTPHRRPEQHADSAPAGTFS
ncbi:MAG TPA: universal stress protein [Streptosporangiaceae bacterium]